ncbi:MAG: amidohydrolase family protein [Candidatus Kariarchaeaceae archaeon]|jgi:imidazolonepropionase-like amidohydrolase
MTYRIDAEFLITGDGDLIKDGSVVVDGNKILYAGGQEGAPASDNTVQTKAVMPGMWDCHGHYVGITTLDFEKEMMTPHMVHGLRALQDAKATLRAGFTSVREVGGYGIYLNRVIQEGSSIGPRIYSAGAALSMTGGHGDIHGLPHELMVASMRDENQWFEHIDGVPSCLKGVRKQLRKGAEVIKIMVSGGVLSEIDHPIHQQFSYEEVRAIVEEAHRAEVAVAAHCHGAPGMKNALDAGVDTIEHGTYLNDELADQMVEQGTVLIPTRLIIEESMLALDSPSVPEYAREKFRVTEKYHREAMRIAIRKGVTIACGTDIAGSKLAKFNKWGTNARELEHYVNAGMTPMDAIVTATGNGPKTLGGRAPKSGLLKEGYDADLLLLKSNPLDNIAALQDKEIFQSVVRQGISY